MSTRARGSYYSPAAGPSPLRMETDLSWSDPSLQAMDAPSGTTLGDVHGPGSERLELNKQAFRGVLTRIQEASHEQQTSEHGAASAQCCCLVQSCIDLDRAKTLISSRKDHTRGVSFLLLLFAWEFNVSYYDNEGLSTFDQCRIGRHCLGRLDCTSVVICDDYLTLTSSSIPPSIGGLSAKLCLEQPSANAMPLRYDSHFCSRTHPSLIVQQSPARLAERGGSDRDLWQACSTKNLASKYNGYPISGMSAGGSTIDQRYTTIFDYGTYATDSAYDCCVTAQKMSNSSTFYYSSSGISFFGAPPGANCFVMFTS